MPFGPKRPWLPAEDEFLVAAILNVPPGRTEEMEMIRVSGRLARDYKVCLERLCYLAHIRPHEGK